MSQRSGGGSPRESHVPKKPYGDAHPTWNMRIHIAEAELALRQGDDEQTIAAADHTEVHVYTGKPESLLNTSQITLVQPIYKLHSATCPPCG